MNHLKIKNFISALEDTHSAEINTNNNGGRIGNVIILSNDEIENENTINKLKDIKIDILTIPKKYKYTFSETKLYDQLKSKMFLENGRKIMKINYF